MKRSNILRAVLAAMSGCGILTCASFYSLIPNPPYNGKKAEPRKADSGAIAENASRINGDLDFAPAFDEFSSAGAVTPPGSKGIEVAAGESPGGMPAVSGGHRKIPVPRRIVRVALLRGVSKTDLYAMDTVEIRSASLRSGRPVRGRIAIVSKGNKRISVVLGDGRAREAALPCTVASFSETNRIDLGNESFRGSMIIAGNGLLSVINYCDVEDYLRGVVPGEMGARGAAAIEAVKAQAVAARTYAYKRIGARRKEPFDVLRGIADQVYDGAGSETAEADFAIRITRDLVVTWGDSLADTYYHSTCGGYTANIEDVWDRPACNYLRSVSHIDPDGIAYCSRSPRFTWEESWSAGELSKMLRLSVTRMLPGERFTGTVLTIHTGERWPCGRLRACRIEGSGGAIECGGDKLRFIFCRSRPDKGILRSANFKVTQNGPQRFVLNGCGYGHGVGLCQMGAVGRARQGHSFERILAAYYKGTELRKVEAVK